MRGERKILNIVYIINMLRETINTCFSNQASIFMSSSWDQDIRIGKQLSFQIFKKQYPIFRF